MPAGTSQRKVMVPPGASSLRVGQLPLLAVIASLILPGCATPPPPSEELESAIEGTWTGTESLELSGRNAVYYSVPIRVALSGRTASVVSLCPRSVRVPSLGPQSTWATTTPPAAPAVDATGRGAAAVWLGTLECPKVELLGCDTVAIRYTNATVTLTRTNQLTVVALGNAEGCATSGPVILTFVGLK